MVIWLGAFWCGCLLAQSPLEQAVTLARQKRYDEADQLIATAAEPSSIPQRIAYHRLKAAIASGLGENLKAVSEMRSALALNPHEASLLLATALAEFQARDLDGALAHAQDPPPSPSSYALIGDIQEKRGDYSKAVSAYRSAIKLAPGEEEYRVALGFELIQHQAFRPAIDILEQSVPLFPKSAKLRTLLGIAQYANGDTKQSITSLEDAIEVDRNLDSSYRCLSKIVLQSSTSPSVRTLGYSAHGTNRFAARSTCVWLVNMMMQNC